MEEPIIQLNELTKKYGDHVAVDHLTLSIYKGEIFGLLGPNGAGKSTTILMMLGLTEPASGEVTVCGINSTRKPIEVKKRVGYLPDDIGFYEDLSGWDNLIYTARLNGIPSKEAEKRTQELLRRVGLSDAAFKKTGTYSRGMRQRLGLADVLIKDPEIIILDEPTLGLDPEGVRDLLKLIQSLSRDEGITVLLSSHHLHQVQQICDRVGLFVKGKLLAEGDIPALSRQLFGEQSVIVEAKIQGMTNSLACQLESLPGMKKVEKAQQVFTFYCTGPMTATIAEIIIKSGAKLLQLNQVEHGLDQIYHRYFEGGWE